LDNQDLGLALIEAHAASGTCPLRAAPAAGQRGNREVSR
jgi:hypothetical protein